MSPPPTTRRAAPAGTAPRKITTTKISHVFSSGAMAIPFQWLREGARLIGEAERCQTVREWKAAAVHFAGIVARLERRTP